MVNMCDLSRALLVARRAPSMYNALKQKGKPRRHRPLRHPPTSTVQLLSNAGWHDRRHCHQNLGEVRLYGEVVEDVLLSPLLARVPKTGAEVTLRFAVGDLNVCDLPLGRQLVLQTDFSGPLGPLPTPTDHLLECFPFALGHDFHAPVAQVPRLPGQAEAVPLELRRVAVIHALHLARNQDARTLCRHTTDCRRPERSTWTLGRARPNGTS
mmetsp:Transcript_28757/g.79202  ORF Transcript_28757/g.79202 Transcript_28757/m.79202 type:complete len:211 (+) Transcript_28757:50-682(+)